jgi:hypothetical protein
MKGALLQVQWPFIHFLDSAADNLLFSIPAENWRQQPFLTKDLKKRAFVSERVNRFMDKRWLTLLMVAFIGLNLFAVGTPTAQDAPEEIMIHSEGYKRKVFKPVKFTHLVHVEEYGIECNECHHDYKEGENVWEEGDPVLKCGLCHNPKKKQGDVHRLVFAYHFNCKTCHKQNEAGPMECKECHAKKGESLEKKAP